MKRRKKMVKIRCPDCEGEGEKWFGKGGRIQCQTCDGSGYITEKKKTSIEREYLRDELSERIQRLKSMEKLNKMLSKGMRPIIFHVPNEGTFIYPSKKDQKKIKKKLAYDKSRIIKLKMKLER